MATILLTRIKKHISSIRWKILFAYLLITVVAFTAVAVSLVQLVGEYLFTQRVRDDQRIAETLSDQLGEALVSLDVDTLLQISHSTASENAGRVLIVDNNGVVQLDTASAMNGRRFLSSEISNVLSGAVSDYGFYDTGVSGKFW